MTEHPNAHAWDNVLPQDALLLDELQAMWQRLDPPPDGLADEMCAVVEAAVAVENLADDYELLTLSATDLASLGLRGDEDDLVVIEFTGRGFDVMLRLAAGRIDGWVAPGGAGTVTLTGTSTLTSDVDEDGRFALDSGVGGPVTLRFELLDGRRHETPSFQV